MARIAYGQVVTNGTPQPLSATPIGPNFWSVKAPASNASTIYIGDKAVTTANGYPLEPGDEREFDLRPVAGALFYITPADLYVVGAGGVAAWVGFL